METVNGTTFERVTADVLKPGDLLTTNSLIPGDIRTQARVTSIFGNGMGDLVVNMTTVKGTNPLHFVVGPEVRFLRIVNER